jgi:cysteine synthase
MMLITGQYFKIIYAGSITQESPNTKIVVCEPADAAMLTSGAPQDRNADGTPHAGHPAWKPHPMQGWAPDFIPKLMDEVDRAKLHKILTVTAADAMSCSQELAAKEGVFVGITSGATFVAALEVAKEARKGANILAMLPDTAERYLSTPLFANTPAEMTPEELVLMRSTPYARPAD